MFVMSQIFKCNLLKYRLVFCSISPALQFFEKQVSVRGGQRAHNCFPHFWAKTKRNLLELFPCSVFQPFPCSVFPARDGWFSVLVSLKAGEKSRRERRGIKTQKCTFWSSLILKEPLFRPTIYCFAKFLPSNFLALNNGNICVKNSETYWHD